MEIHFKDKYCEYRGHRHTQIVWIYVDQYYINGGGIEVISFQSFLDGYIGLFNKVKDNQKHIEEIKKFIVFNLETKNV